MLKPYLLSALTTGVLTMALMACQPSTTTPEVVPPATEDPVPTPGEEDTGGDRSAYSEIPVPEGAVGADPTEVALATFGSTEPGEGNFEEEAELVEQTDEQALVILTQTGLADDSVNGMRYYLEFVPEGDQWRLDWAGRQVRCQVDRGSQEWTTDLCS
ncbi:hypothetical protein IQ265_27835 [Nodosilinea sp. LEGE 06152]|uniref:hypothetical protein n=1 Tax=Nodosilinea sp. LEGE 06152 TaxID=2777966 RepID=UPI00187EB9EF|nr:hypothetical protein [Nodosilinea sp. LEGE 06152]MBE9160603.1 hypothetical protein [Nodosilinea sp. LEGE 06152]